MKDVAKVFGKEVLRDVDEKEFYERITEVREKCTDRSVLRAIHFFSENRRVEQLVDALKNDDFDKFKVLIQDSGNSSYKFLQNVYASCDLQNQAISIALAMSEIILGDYGICRVHGGGFAGTIQAFVADEYVNTYKEEIEKIFCKNSCHVLKVRKYGGKKIL